LGDLIKAVSHLAVGVLCLEGKVIAAVRAWLVSRGEGAAGAAAVSQMLGGRDLADIIEGARKHFLYVAANKLTKEDMAVNKPDSSLRKHSKRGKLGDVDAFVSHSWSDDSDAKWEVLQQWIQEFKKDHNGQEPTLWIDKYCIDQNNIEESLACLPVFLAGTRQLLILCGPTYLQRLWCLVEIMVFIEMGGDKEHLDVRLLDDDAVPTTQTTNLRSSIRVFDPRDAKCFTDEDTAKLLAIIETTGYDRIQALVQDVFR